MNSPMHNHQAFIGGTEGHWEVITCATVAGAGLCTVDRLRIVSTAEAGSPASAAWVLKGFTSNVRYAERHELTQLRARQQGLDRPTATHAALIPIRKNPQWWAMAQDERRQIFEAESHHTRTGLAYLPEIARQLYHCRDLGEPFDFLTWFEFSAEQAPRFDHLLEQLRATREWQFVDREIDIRLVRCLDPAR